MWTRKFTNIILKFSIIRKRLEHWVTRRFPKMQILACVVPSFNKVPSKIFYYFSRDTHLNIMPRHSCSHIRMSLLLEWVVKIISSPSFLLGSMSEAKTTRFLAYLRGIRGDASNFIILNEVMVVVPTTIS